MRDDVLGPVRRGFRAAALVAGASGACLTACQPVPHPFEDDRPPASLLAVRSTVGVSVAPVGGVPENTAAKLSEAVAKALREREIPASESSVSPGSYVLYGRIEAKPARAGNMTVATFWRLRDGHGALVGETRERFDGGAREWRNGDDALVAQVATKSAADLAALLQEGPAPVETVDAGHVRVSVGHIEGAPGDGGQSLAAAVGIVLKRQDVTFVENGKGKPDLYVDADVTVTPVKPDKQHVKIVWRVRRAAGGEVGTVAQENDVPRGRLDGPWGDLAYTVALAAADGLGDLLARATPPPGRT